MIVLIIMSFSFYSCSSTIHLSSYSEANRKVGNGSAVLHMKSGKIYDGEQIQFGKKSILFINQDNDSLMQINTQDLEYVFVTHRIGGVLEGFLIGGAVGTGTGYVSSLRFGEGGEAKANRILASMFVGVIGGLAGMAVGAAKGHEYVFYLPQDSSSISIQDK